MLAKAFVKMSFSLPNVLARQVTCSVTCSVFNMPFFFSKEKDIFVLPSFPWSALFFSTLTAGKKEVLGNKVAA